MAEKPCLGVERSVEDEAELVGDVLEVFRPFQGIRHKADGVFRIEGFRHVKAVKPHLVRIHPLVPETAFRGAGLFPKLGVEAVHCGTVLLLSGNVVKLEKRAAGADVVQSEVILLVLVDSSGTVYNGIVPCVHIVQDFTVFGFLVHVKHSLEFKTRGVVPLEVSFLAVNIAGFRVPGHFAPDNFQRQRGLGRACGQGNHDDKCALSHLLLYGSQTIPSSFWYITFSKV